MSDIQKATISTDNQPAEIPPKPVAPADSDRQERMAKFAEERIERVRQAKADRAAELELAEKAQLQDARDHLAGFADINKARQTMSRDRKTARHRRYAQIAVFIVLPTLFVASYLSIYATPFYEARTTIAVRAQESTPARSQSNSGIFGSTTPGGLQEAFLARAYMLSPEMLAALQDETRILDFVAGEEVDPISARRFPFVPAPARMAAFHRLVKVNIDIQAGLITLIVRAPVPEQAEAWSARAIALTRTRIDTVEESRMQTALADAHVDTQAARVRLQEARAVLTSLQTGSGNADPHTQMAITYELIAGLESEHQVAERELAALRLRYGSDNALVRRRAVEADLIAQKIAEYRNSISGNAQGEPLAVRAAVFDQATLDVSLAQATWSERLRSEEAARRAAKRNRAVLSVITAPYAPDIPASPDILKTSLLTALILAGIYTFLTIIGASFRRHDLSR